jgi:hypothetical protein
VLEEKVGKKNHGGHIVQVRATEDEWSEFGSPSEKRFSVPRAEGLTIDIDDQSSSLTKTSSKP